MKKNTFILMCLSFFIVGCLFSQETVYVSASGAGAMDGTTEANAYADFSTALGAINSATDVLRVLGDMEPGTNNLSSKNFVFTIEGDAGGSTLTRTAASRMFTIDSNFDVKPTFKNIIFTATVPANVPGGILFSNKGSIITFENCTFNKSTTSHSNGGGAIATNQANVRLNITGCTFYQNASTNASGKGGAISLILYKTATVTNSFFQENTSAGVRGGGAIFLGDTNGVFTATGTTFYRNSSTNATSEGGAITFNKVATSTITNCTFYENKIVRASVNFGAAIRWNAGNTGTVTVSNSLFYNNKVNNGGGNPSDFGAATDGTKNITNSIGQFVRNIDLFTDSTIKVANNAATTAANLTNSNLAFNTTLQKVTYTAPNHTINDDTPIDFGSDMEDVGAWDSKINIFLGITAGKLEAWNEVGNWSNGALPGATDHAAVLQRTASVNINVKIIDLKLVGFLKIVSGKSLIVTGNYDDNSGSGTVSYRPKLNDVAGDDKGWYLITAPVSGVTFNDAFVTTNDIAVGNVDRAIASYTTSADTWSYLQSGGSIAATPGQGYQMKLDTDPDAPTGIVFLNGALNTGDVNGVPVSPAGNGFNLLGSPYTSFMSSATFLAANTNLNQSQIWTWNHIDDFYTAQVAGDDFVLAPAQGFFVQATSGTVVNFAETNQANTGAAFQRGASRTEVKLLMTDGTSSRFAKIYYLDIATTGFDTGWEGETFGGIKNSLDVFTHLVTDNQGKNYQIQSLPISELETLEVAVGVTVPAGKEIIFSAETMNLTAGVNLFLEDRELNVFTQLDQENSTYKVTPPNAIDGVGRFYIHASSSALSTDDVALDNISIYKADTATLRIVGLSQGKVSMKLFSILGKQLLNKNFVSNGVQDIALPKLATGIYLVQIETEKGKLSKKIILE